LLLAQIVLYWVLTSLHGESQQNSHDHENHQEQLAERQTMLPHHLRSLALDLLAAAFSPLYAQFNFYF
jgi:hypothetical protein